MPTFLSNMVDAELAAIARCSNREAENHNLAEPVLHDVVSLALRTLLCCTVSVSGGSPLAGIAQLITRLAAPPAGFGLYN